MTQAQIVSDILALLEDEHALYCDLLNVSKQQERVLNGLISSISLETLMRKREDLYMRIDASERTRQTLLDELPTPPDEVREVAFRIGETLRAILTQDQLNERLLQEEALASLSA